MKIKKKYPPNYKEILDYFPQANKKGIVFTYGDTLYSPTSLNIPKHLLVHEKTHSKQQNEMGIEKWWEKYFTNKKFRFSQELEAYQNQYNFIEKKFGRHERRVLLRQISKDLSGKLYGNLVSLREAKIKIKIIIEERKAVE